MSYDFKKEFKEIYCPKRTPEIVAIPEMTFIMVDGEGNPNTSQAYHDACEILYGLSYSIKMSKMNGTQPEGYFEYVVPPLEGLWWVELENFNGHNVADKNLFKWTSMIRQPDFVTPEVFEAAKEALHKKKPALDFSNTRLQKWTEGLCAQFMHYGIYDDEGPYIQAMDDFVVASGYECDICDTRWHHEIYLGDPRKCKPEKNRTIVRHPIKKSVS